MMRLLFCNIGWMTHYQGQTEDDKIVGGGKYVAVQKHGHEVCNFVNVRGQCYGYVQPVHQRIDVAKLGAKPGENFAKDVDVVITARRPEGKTVIVGWYRRATVYEMPQQIPRVARLHRMNDIQTFRYTARAEDVYLLPFDQRTIGVLRGKGGMGQSNVWYARTASAEWLSKVHAILRHGTISLPRRHSRKHDSTQKILVEQAAVGLVRRYFEETLNYVVEDVSKANRGWDLQASLESVTLNIEVKGLSGGSKNIELTPNEYKAFQKRSANYRLCIVTDALSDPKLTICRVNSVSGEWMAECEVGRPEHLVRPVEEVIRVAAIIRVK